MSARANQLLSAAFGPRFTLELITQAAKKTGGTKEVFTIQVIDNERGGAVRDLAELSGGEQVIVNEAIINAMAIFMNERSEMPIRTCWRDETTGPLDAENSERYIDMLRSVRSIGGFDHVLFVTHSEASARLADVQLVCADGGVTWNQPPY